MGISKQLAEMAMDYRNGNVAGNPMYSAAAGGSGGPSEWSKFVNELNGNSSQNQFAADQADLAYARNSAEAQKDRDFQLYMSNTAYQRAVSDMKAAGLNPAAVGGDAASTPSGAMATASPASPSSSGTDMIGTIAGIARAAISIALFKKFSHSAALSGSAAGAVSKIGQEMNEVRHVLNKAGQVKFSTKTHRIVRDLMG